MKSINTAIKFLFLAHSAEHLVFFSTFKRFQQVNSPGNLDKRGTGLGLAIAKHTSEYMEGEIWVESIVEEGSTFYFRIPMIYSPDPN
ncbi:MAG: ATP-binding protein [Bacteroidota bacterium]|nr:ATP-binding protein [Bacteroidota bacterium]